jgi:hypothetical protein
LCSRTEIKLVPDSSEITLILNNKPAIVT